MQWPTCLPDNNFYVALPSAEPILEENAAVELSAVLSMSVKPVSVENTIRCLGTRLSVAADTQVRCVLAFRTDADRQGKSGDVTSWPMPDDPRTPLLLSGLLAELAAKLRFYSATNVSGYTATVRRLHAFVRQRGYSHRLWP